MALEASEYAPEDYISSMPDNVITNILHLLPLQDAVRTGILSRSWRFKWTMLNHLLLDENFYLYVIEKQGEKGFGKIISRLLLHINDAITKFVVNIAVLDVEDIHHLILFLSRRGIKDLTLTDWTKPHVKLPTRLFSCLELKRLIISGCDVTPPPSFCGFPNLLSLALHGVHFGGSDLGEFLTRCPLLETLDLSYLSYAGNLKVVEIAKLENLKILSLSLCNLETTTTISPRHVFELVGYLPKLQELGLDFLGCRMTEGGATKKFPTAFPSLKAFKITRMDLGNGIMLSIALEMIRHFPNLQILEVAHIADTPRISIPIPILEVEVDMMELRSVVFKFFKGLENEVYLIKYILVCSPSLEKVVIYHDWFSGPDEQLIFSKKLLKLHRASQAAEIIFN